MERVGVRALQQNVAAVLKRVRRGERVEVTDRGRPVAWLVPAKQGSVVQRLRATGRMMQAEGDLLELGAPLSLKKGVESGSRRLEKMRARER